ncbi:TPA: pilus assembly protein [Klebsiella aerogenes]|nr:pilus assembly protein [Klebsiella aerogenes]
MGHYGAITLVVLSGALFCSGLMAADMTFKGVLVDPPPCTINGDQPVRVNFGDNIGVNRVNGTNYIQSVEYHLTCDITSPQEGLSVVLTTTDPAAFDASAIQSSIDGLAIRVLVDGAPVTFGDVI